MRCSRGERDLGPTFLGYQRCPDIKAERAHIRATPVIDGDVWHLLGGQVPHGSVRRSGAESELHGGPL